MVTRYWIAVVARIASTCTPETDRSILCNTGTHVNLLATLSLQHRRIADNGSQIRANEVKRILYAYTTSIEIMIQRVNIGILTRLRSNKVSFKHLKKPRRLELRWLMRLIDYFGLHSLRSVPPNSGNIPASSCMRSQQASCRKICTRRFTP